MLNNTPVVVLLLTALAVCVVAITIVPSVTQLD